MAESPFLLTCCCRAVMVTEAVLIYPLLPSMRCREDTSLQRTNLTNTSLLKTNSKMLTLPLALCRWQWVNVNRVTCFASTWMWQVAQVTLVIFRTLCLAIIKLEIVIGRINYCDKKDPYCLSKNAGRQEVKCFILLLEAASVQYLSIIVSLQSVQYWGHTYLIEWKTFSVCVNHIIRSTCCTDIFRLCPIHGYCGLIKITGISATAEV